MKKHNSILLLLILLAIIVVAIKLFSSRSEVTVEIVKGSVTTKGIYIKIPYIIKLIFCCSVKLFFKINLK